MKKRAQKSSIKRFSIIAFFTLIILFSCLLISLTSALDIEPVNTTSDITANATVNSIPIQSCGSSESINIFIIIGLVIIGLAYIFILIMFFRHNLIFAAIGFLAIPVYYLARVYELFAYILAFIYLAFPIFGFIDLAVKTKKKYYIYFSAALIVITIITIILGFSFNAC